MPLSKICIFCKKQFIVYRLFTKTKYCSRICFYNHRKIILIGKNNPFFGKKHTQQTKEKLSLKLKGRPRNSGTFQKEGRTLSGEKHPLWKGDKISYNGLHKWLYRCLDNPDTCEHCGKTGLKGKEINWANKSGEYKRDLNDWIRLCRLCHEKYDKRNDII